MLSRWIAYKRDEERGIDSRKPQRRPALASDCETVSECEKWRMQILREVGRKVMDIQNESLGEQRIRDLNDEINKLLREKGHWERRIIELGGPNYRVCIRFVLTRNTNLCLRSPFPIHIRIHTHAHSSLNTQHIRRSELVTHLQHHRHEHTNTHHHRTTRTNTYTHSHSHLHTLIHCFPEIRTYCR